ncbi:hypothetical protein JCM10450v2_005806 [Rhodotorula kratochvilovae]
MLVSAYGSTYTPLDLSWATAYPLSFLPTCDDLRAVPAPIVARPPLRASAPLVPTPRSSSAAPLEPTSPTRKRPREESAAEERATSASSRDGQGSARRGTRGRTATMSAEGKVAREPRWAHDRFDNGAAAKGRHPSGGRKKKKKKRGARAERAHADTQRTWLAAQGEAPAQGRVSPPTRPSPAPSSPDPPDDFNALVFDIPSLAASATNRTRSLANPGEPRGAQPVSPAPAAVKKPMLPSSTRALPVVLGTDVLFPDLKQVQWRDYEPYLLARPTEPRWSGPLYNRYLAFLCACEPPAHWTKAPDRLTVYNTVPPLAMRIGACQPDKRALQAAHSPRAAEGYATLTKPMQVKFRAMCDVMRWLWDDESLGVDAVADLVKRAPLAVHIIVREYASIRRCSELAARAEEDLVYFLSRRGALSPQQHAVRTLLAWLRRPAAPNRHYLFFCRPGGELRLGVGGEAPWAWWFDRALGPEGAGVRELDEWERGRLREEDWSGV